MEEGEGREGERGGGEEGWGKWVRGRGGGRGWGIIKG